MSIGRINAVCSVPIPTWLSVAGGVVLLDLAVYLQHALFHTVPAL